MHIRNTQKAIAEVHKYPPDLCRKGTTLLLLQWYKYNIMYIVAQYI